MSRRKTKFLILLLFLSYELLMVTEIRGSVNWKSIRNSLSLRKFSDGNNSNVKNQKMREIHFLINWPIVEGISVYFDHLYYIQNEQKKKQKK